MNVANCITMIRIIGTICLLFVSFSDPTFYVIYTIAGLSDACDGYIARVTKTSSAFGAALDSFADLILYAVMAFKILPEVIAVLKPIEEIWYVVALIVIIRLTSYIIVAIKYRRFASLHTKLNKVTGFAVFMLPYMIKVPHINIPYCIAACAISGISTVQEIIIHLKSNEYEGKEKQ